MTLREVLNIATSWGAQIRKVQPVVMGSFGVPQNFDLILGHRYWYQKDFHINIFFHSNLREITTQERLPSKDQHRRDRAERSDQHERGDRERKAGDRKEVTKRWLLMVISRDPMVISWVTPVDYYDDYD